MGNKFLDGTALTIAIIGAINWALIGIFRFDLVAFIFGDMSFQNRLRNRRPLRTLSDQLLYASWQQRGSNVT